MKKKYVCVIILFFGLCYGVSIDIECTARGRFPNDESSDCRGYTMCLQSGLTNFTQYRFMCPMGSVYNHLEEKCTNATNYKCMPNFKCTSVGKFAVPEITDCSSYVACIEGLRNINTARLVGCPSNTFFDSTAGVCVNDTVFSCTTFELNRDVIPVNAPESAALTMSDVTTSVRDIFTYIYFTLILNFMLLYCCCKC